MDNEPHVAVQNQDDNITGQKFQVYDHREGDNTHHYTPCSGMLRMAGKPAHGSAWNVDSRKKYDTSALTKTMWEWRVTARKDSKHESINE